MQQSNDEKKEYLKSYLRMRAREQELEREIEAIRSKYTGHAIIYSDMPKGGRSDTDLSDYAAEVDELLGKMIARQQESVRRYQEIEHAIEQLKDTAEKQLLRTRYLLGITDWEKIGDAINYSARHAQTIHGRALSNFRIPEKTSYNCVKK